jgi:SSS family solute:Na+ symporter
MKFIYILFVLQFFYWWIGKRSSQNVKTQEDYYLAGKSVSLFPLMMTFLATQVGGGLVLGSADEAYNYGWTVLCYPLGAALGLILLGLGLGARLARLPVSTVAQIFELVYRSPLLRKVAAALSVLSLFMILVAQVIASRKFLIAMGLSNPWIFSAFWAIIILYTVRGGLKAVISTDIAQAAFFSLIFFFSFGYVALQGDIPSSVETFAVSTSKLTGWLFMPLLFMIIEQDMGQRCFAGKSPKIVSQASLLAGLIALAICAVPVYFGVLAKSSGLVIPPGSSVLMVAISTWTNPWITTLVGCAILAAIVSTATSLINAISSNLANDFFQERGSLRSMQWMTAGFSVGALVVAFSFNNVVDILIQSYELSVSALFVPIFFSLFRKTANTRSAALAMVMGMIGFFFTTELISLLLSAVGFVASELIYRYRPLRVVK